MSTLLSPQEFRHALRNMPGMPENAVAECVECYDGTARAAQRVLPQMPNLGLFSSQRDRIAAFLSVCKHLDTLVEQKEVSQNEALSSLTLMMLSDKNFHKAFKAFTNWAPQFRSDLTTDSETADMYWRACRGSYSDMV